MGGRNWEYCYEVSILPIKEYNVILKRTWTNCECTGNTKTTTKEILKRNIVDMLRKERKNEII